MTDLPTMPEKMADPLPEIQEALDYYGVPAFTTEPAPTPPGPYVMLYGNTGQAGRYRIGRRRPKGRDWRFLAVLTSRTVDGLRDITLTVTAALTGLRVGPPSWSPIREVSAGPQLEGGPEADRRLTQTIEFGIFTTTEKEAP